MYHLLVGREASGCRCGEIRTTLLCDVTRHLLVVPYRRFWTDRRAPLQGPSQEECWEQGGQNGLPETPVTKHQSTLRKIAEERRH